MTEQQLSTQEFEFNASQEDTVRDLAKKMNFVGLLLLIVGALTILGSIASFQVGVVEVLAQAGMGVIYVLIGRWTRSASRSFNQIVDTEGQDVTNLMAALTQLQKLYTLQYWAFGVFLVLTVLGLLIGIAVAVTGQ